MPSYIRGALLLALAAAPAQSQLSRIKDKIKERANQRADEAADSLVNRGEKGIKCVVTDRACINKAHDAGQKVVVTDASGKALANQADSESAPAGAAGAAQPSLGELGSAAWANFDFVPGTRVLFAEDFTHDNIGDFPKHLQLKEGNLEVVDVQGARYLRAVEGNAASVVLPLPEVLPARFTLEFDYAPPSDNSLDIKFTDGAASAVTFSYDDGGTTGGVESKGSAGHNFENKLFHARVMADGQHVKVYMNEERVANVPQIDLGRSNKIYFAIPWNGTKLITNIRVAAGGRKLYDALAENGRVTTQGIYFATASATLQPESKPTLDEIAAMLKDHADLKLAIEGHTDNVGQAAANQTLSEQRAQAVRDYLVNKAGIDTARLQAHGLGSTKPVAPNDTPEGRQTNRRVELVKT